MLGYVKKVSGENTESKDGAKDKLDTEVISMYVVPVWVGYRNSRGNAQDICYARQLLSMVIY